MKRIEFTIPAQEYEAFKAYSARLGLNDDVATPPTLLRIEEIWDRQKPKESAKEGKPVFDADGNEAGRVKGQKAWLELFGHVCNGKHRTVQIATVEHNKETLRALSNSHEEAAKWLELLTMADDPAKLV